MKTVTVTFTNRYSTGYSDKSYDYLVADDTEVQAGDFAVAHNGTEFAIVRVQSVSQKISQKANKTLVTIINNKVIEAYKLVNESVNEQKALFQRLEQLLAQESENNKYRLLASSNKEAADILAKLGIS